MRLLTAAHFVFAGMAFGQVAFDVVSIKPLGSIEGMGMGMSASYGGTKIEASRVTMPAVPLFRLVCMAYGLKPYQISAPDWMKSTLFEVRATIPVGVSQEKVPEMLQAMLAERFGLQVHHESREQAVYALVVAKGGVKMKESEAATAPAVDVPKPAMDAVMPTLQGDVHLSKGADGIYVDMPGGEIRGRIRVTPMQGADGKLAKLHLESAGMTMKTFAELLSTGAVERPVVDLTELKGRYDVAVDISEFDAMGVVAASVMAPPGNGGGAADPSGSLLRASITKLGLVLEARRLMVEMLVVDRGEKVPAGN